MKSISIWKTIKFGILSHYLKVRSLLFVNWIFKTKRDSEGNVVGYKARLVAKCFTQTEDIDFIENFALFHRKTLLGQLYLLLHILTLSYIRWMLRQLFSMVTLMKLYIWCNQKLCVWRPKKYGLQTKKIHLWTQASFPTMVLQLSSSNCLIWFRDKCCWKLYVSQVQWE